MTSAPGIDRRIGPGGAPAVLVALVLGFSTAACGRDPQPPGADADATPVVLIVVDTLRRDHLGCYRHSRDSSPHLDRLAADAVLYRRCFSHAPWTTPSVGALLTSRYPTALGIRDVRSPLPEEEATLAELLGEQGYQNAAVVSHSFCSARWNFDQGFELFDESNIVGHAASSAAGVTARALEFLDGQRDPQRPFFLWLHYFDPHFDYFEHPDFDFGGTAGYVGPIRSGMTFKQLLQARRHMTEQDVAELRRIYDSEIAFTDAQIGRVLERLRELDLYDRALIVFTADHGEEFLDHGLLGHTKTLYQEVLHVPLLVKYPRGTAAVFDPPVAHVDVVPTVLDVLGIEWDPADGRPPLEGRSLRDLDPDTTESPPIFLETSKKRTLRGVLVGNLKLIHDLETGQSELYHLTRDPGETHDLVSERRRAVGALRQQLDSWMARVRAPDATPELELSAEERRGLGALGYLDDGHDEQSNADRDGKPDHSDEDAPERVGD